MGIEERKERERRKRKNDIIDAAEDVIFPKGIEHATMDEIAEKAELSKGTLYLYFKNKTDLYLAINIRGLTLLNQRFAEVLTENRPGIELVGRLGETYIDFVKNQPEYFKAMLFYESYDDVEELKESKVANACEDKGREALTYAIRALQIGMQDDTIDDTYDPKMLAVQLWGGLRGIIQLYHMKSRGHYLSMLDEFELDLEMMFKNFMNLILKGISKSSNTDSPKKM